MPLQVGSALDKNLKVTLGGKEVSVGELTEGKKIVLVAVPGAFTPTCSETVR